MTGRFVIPAAFVRAAPARAATIVPREGTAAPEAARLSGAALVVEDNMIIALEAEEILTLLGAQSVDMAGSVHEALRLIDLCPPAFALLDVNLGTETSLAVARRLMASGVPFVFASGYGDSFRIPPELGAIPMVKKPYTADILRQALAGVGGPRTRSPEPPRTARTP